MLRRLASGRLVLVWNRPHPEGQDRFPLTGGDGLWSEVPVSNHRGELSIAFSADDGESWTAPVVIARQPGKWLSYPYVFEPSPGTLWITTMQGAVRVELREEEFVEGRR
jgi:sialidase-1